jgi:O-antigen/teichoic acid export membrane protein
LLSAGWWSFAGRFAAIGLFFLSDMILARALTKTDFAAFFLATQATVFLGTVVALGTPQILSRTIRQTLHGPHPGVVRTVIQRCSRLLIFGSLASSIVFYVVAPWLAANGPQWAPFRNDRLGIVAWSCLGAACLNSAFTLQALDDFRTATFVASRRGGILPNLLFVVFSLFSWRWGFISTSTLILAQVAFQAVTLIVARRAISRQLDRLLAHTPSEMPGKGNASPTPSSRWYLAESLPFLVTMLVASAIDELDGLWVGLLVDETATANYGAAKRLVRLMTVPYVMFGLSLAPFVAELLVKNEIARLQRILRAAATLVSLPMLAALGVYMIAPEWVLTLAFGTSFREAAPLLQWLTVGPALIVICGHNTQVLLMSGRQRTLMALSLAALAVYGTVLYPAVRYFGVNGAAATQSIVFGLLACTVMLTARRQVGIWTIASIRPTEIAAAWKALRRRPDAAKHAQGAGD